MQKLTPFLWFDTQAEEAANFYVSVFKNSEILKTTYYTEGTPGKAGTVMTVSFSIDGQKFIALNGGTYYKINEAISFIINCDTQEEIDFLWEKLSEDGEKIQCGWLKDKYGVTWQVIPSVWEELISSTDLKKTERVMQAMMKMKKLDIEILKKAYDG